MRVIQLPVISCVGLGICPKAEDPQRYLYMKSSCFFSFSHGCIHVKKIEK